MMTMADLAKELGVSQSTVSRVLNGNRKKISSNTINRIQAKAQEVGFVANRMAVNLRSKRSGLIGVMLPKFSANKYELGMAICQAARKHDLTPLFTFHGCSSDERLQALRTLISQNIEGLITLEANLITQPLNFPVINLFGYVPAVNSFADNHNNITQEIFLHLKALGHKKIAYIGVKSQSCNSRVVAFNRLKGNYDLEFLDECCFLYKDLSEINHIIEKIVSIPRRQRPSVIILSTDFSAFAAIKHLIELGFSVPDDFSIISYNDQQEAKYFNPPLTTVKIDQNNLAERILETLVAHIENPNQPLSHELIHGKLVIRKSTAPIISN